MTNGRDASTAEFERALKHVLKRDAILFKDLADHDTQRTPMKKPVKIPGNKLDDMNNDVRTAVLVLAESKLAAHEEPTPQGLWYELANEAVASGVEGSWSYAQWIAFAAKMNTAMFITLDDIAEFDRMLRIDLPEAHVHITNAYALSECTSIQIKAELVSNLVAFLDPVPRNNEYDNKYRLGSLMLAKSLTGAWLAEQGR